MFAAGVGAALGIWALSAVLLFVVGLSFYAPTTGLFLALAVALVAAPVAYLRVRRRRPHALPHLAYFLAGAVAFLLYGCIAVAITSPHTIFPGAG